MVENWCGGLSLSAAKEVIRAARDAVRHPGKYEGQDAWVAWLHQSEWAASPDYEVGSVDERGWSGYWKLDGFDLTSPHWLFRELRPAKKWSGRHMCPTIKALVLEENDQGFVRGYAWERGLDVLQEIMEDNFGPLCSECGGALGLDPLDGSDDQLWCRNCADECAGCGDAFLRGDLKEVTCGDHSGEYMCHDCCVPCGGCGGVVCVDDVVELASGDFACPDCTGKCAECGDMEFKTALFAGDHGGICPRCIADSFTPIPDPVAPSPADAGIAAAVADDELRSFFALLSPATRQTILGDLVDRLIGDDVAAAQSAARFARVLLAVGGGAS